LEKGFAWPKDGVLRRVKEGSEVSERRVALLRGVNVGRAKRLAMADLRALVEDLGYEDVRTLQNSGNIIFSLPRTKLGNPATRIEKEVASRLGVSARVTVLTAAEVVAAVRDNPLSEVANNPSRLLIMVLADPAVKMQLKPLMKQSWNPEAIALGRRVAYLWCPRGVIDSQLSVAVSRVLGDTGTARNMATMMKLQALIDGV
jgi:uncharacterized protein (DUF1697 family)